MTDKRFTIDGLFKLKYDVYYKVKRNGGNRMAFGLFKKEKPITEMTFEEAFLQGERYRKKKAELALEYYTHAAEGGYRKAQAACASCYENGIGCEKDIKKSLGWLEKFAENGTPEEQLECAEKFKESKLWEKEEKALYWTEKAAEQGLCEAQMKCASMHDWSYGCTRDDAVALQWYEKAAAQGNVDAIYECACKYELEGHPFSDKVKALLWFEKAMNQGHKYAKDSYEQLAQIVEKQKIYAGDTSAKLSEGERLLQEAIQAEKAGDIEWAAETYIKTARETKDSKYAVKAFDISMNSNPRLYLRAGTAAELAQELGYPNTDAMFTRMYLELAANSEEEYKQAIDEFHKKKQPLGASCYKDPYVSRMRESVLYYHEKLADLGHSSSCVAIAKQLYSDYKTTDDPRKLEEAAEMIIRAQSAGETAACGAWGNQVLGDFYHHRADKEENWKDEPQEALTYYRKSAELGHQESMYHVARMLYQSDILKDIKEAKMWAEKVVQSGCEKAIKLLNLLIAKEASFNARYIEETGLDSKKCYERMQFYRGNKFHAEPYVNLGKAFLYAIEYLRLTESANKEKMNAIKDALKGNTAHIGSLISGYIVKIQNKKISGKAVEIIIPVYETILLQQACAYELRAEQGDISAMQNLFFLYDEVGSYTLTQKTGISIMSLRFSGNRARGRYWLDRAIAKGDARAMRYKGEYYYIYGASEEEGKEYLKMAASRGDSMAVEDLQLKQLESETKARYQAEAMALAKSLNIDGGSTEGESGPIPIEYVPDVINGPYGHKYQLISRGLRSAEYRNVDTGEIVNINESHVGALGATTEAGYFWW